MSINSIGEPKDQLPYEFATQVVNKMPVEFIRFCLLRWRSAFDDGAPFRDEQHMLQASDLMWRGDYGQIGDGIHSLIDAWLEGQAP